MIKVNKAKCIEAQMSENNTAGNATGFIQYPNYFYWKSIPTVNTELQNRIYYIRNKQFNVIKVL